MTPVGLSRVVLDALAGAGDGGLDGIDLYLDLVEDYPLLTPDTLHWHLLRLRGAGFVTVYRSRRPGRCWHYERAGRVTQERAA